LHAPGESSTIADVETEPNIRTQDPPHDVQLYDARGHPFNPWARAQGRHLIEAQNDILSVIGVTERKIPIEGQRDFNQYLVQHGIDPDEESAGDLVGNAADLDYQLSSWWIHAFTNRLLVFPPSEDISFLDLMKLHYKTLGWKDFIQAGLPSFLLSHVVNPEMWTQYIVYRLDRAIIASVSSKQWRDTYNRAKPGIAVV